MKKKSKNVKKFNKKLQFFERNEIKKKLRLIN